ncbi:MAG: EthD domain-containing protein [Gammaproteobacteria bacterium]|nr:EthD domain-containing protein [Gammaproteobacteria bacterium]
MHTTSGPFPATPPEATPGAKMLYLIKRKPATSREELVAHWFANHMPAVIQGQQHQVAQGKPHPRRYIVTLYEANEQGEHLWDGIAQLWWDRPLRRPEVAHGTTPTDTFQQKAEPYVPWASTEYVVIDGADTLKVEPLTLNAPFPCTSSGFYKVSYLVKAKVGIDFDQFYSHWLHTHVPNVSSIMAQVGGFRYVVSHSIEPQVEPYAGLAELYFHDEAEWAEYRKAIKPDGMEEWVDGRGTLVLGAKTEMIGLP